MNDISNLKKIKEAKILTENALNLTAEINRQLSHARVWGIVDIVGGGLITNLIKHHKLNNVKLTIENLNRALTQLKNILPQINLPQDMEMKTNLLFSFCDFYDNLLFDSLMQIKIVKSKKEIEKLNNLLENLDQQLAKMLS